MGIYKQRRKNTLEKEVDNLIVIGSKSMIIKLANYFTIVLCLLERWVLLVTI